MLFDKKIWALPLLLAFNVVTAQQRTIQVLSATVKDKRIENAEVFIQKSGVQTIAGRTDDQGNVTINAPFNDNNDALIIIKKPGYSTLVAKCPCDKMTYAISPAMKNLDGMRIVLTWGYTPSDLDAHLAYAGNHIYWDSKNGDEANLDVDDIDSYGPETITIDQKKYGTNYVYAVHDYSYKDNPQTTDLSMSKAKVFVYVGESLVRTYYVPEHARGNLWTVFQITPEGELEDIDQLAELNADPHDFTYATLLDGYDSSVPAVYFYNIDGAKENNRLGENAYHNGRLEEAVNYYKAAIDIDPVYGLAYGNLGLAYQKLGRNAEALWADREAIALAEGNTAYTVRAGAYYNMGRIYEAGGQFSNALRCYKQAQEEKSNTVYTNAINRVQTKANQTK